jgi:hypothetical protein
MREVSRDLKATPSHCLAISRISVSMDRNESHPTMRQHAWYCNRPLRMIMGKMPNMTVNGSSRGY